jgi:hypothetical protein
MGATQNKHHTTNNNNYSTVDKHEVACVGVLWCCGVAIYLSSRAQQYDDDVRWLDRRRMKMPPRGSHLIIIIFRVRVTHGTVLWGPLKRKTSFREMIKKQRKQKRNKTCMSPCFSGSKVLLHHHYCRHSSSDSTVLMVATLPVMTRRRQTCCRPCYMLHAASI